jgi:hypothetical protein
MKTIHFHKTFKKNLGNYNMLETGYGMDIEVKEDQKLDEGAVWKHIDQVLFSNGTDIDPDWIKSPEKNEKP